MKTDKERISELEDQVEFLTSKLGTWISNCQQFDEEIGYLMGKKDSLEYDISTLEGRNDELDGAVYNLKRKIEGKD